MQTSFIVPQSPLVVVEATVVLITAKIYEILKTGKKRLLRNKQITQANISVYSVIEKLIYSPQKYIVKSETPHYIVQQFSD